MFIPYGHQNISQDDIDAVIEVLRSDWLTQGPSVERFEKAIASYCESQYGVAVANGTAALHLACLGLGLTVGDYLWTSPNSFVASANCGRYCGAEIDFVDIDSHTYNMCVKALALKLAQTPADLLPKIVVPVHFAGQPCDLIAMRELADQYGFKLLVDGCHALGAKYHGHPVGCNVYADATVFSFHPVKTMTTAEGGMVLTNDKQVADTIARLRAHGITRDANLTESDNFGGWYYEQLELGFNYRISDLQAALGVSQMTRVNDFVRRRQSLADRYQKLLSDLPLQLPEVSAHCQSAWHLFVVLVQSDLRDKVFAFMRESGIGVQVHYIPIHLQPYYRQLGFKLGDFPQAEQYYAQAISLPIYYDLTDEQQDYVVSKLMEVLACSLV